MKKLLAIVSCFIILFSLFASVNPGIMARASGTVSTVDILNASNTYNLATDKKGEAVIGARVESGRDNSTQYYLSYDLTKKNERRVSDKTSVTIFTPGYGMGAETWSNQPEFDRDFGYDPDSILSKLAEKVENPSILWGRATGYNECEYYDITDDTSMRFDVASMEPISITPELAPGHIILVYDPDSYYQSDSNANAYYRFNYAVSSLLYQIQRVNGGWLPKVNLIGHSRGGLVNLLYAMDHPDLVSNMISIGTPYQGSTSATVAKDTDFGGDGLNDIINENLYNGYRSRWNENYEGLYSGINVLAIGGYSTIDFLSDIAHNDESKMDLTKWEDLIDIGVGAIIAAKAAILTNSTGVIVTAALKTVARALNTMYPQAQATAIADIIFNELEYDVNFPFVSWYSDTLVPLDSQLGKGRTGDFAGFQTQVKCFQHGDGTDFTKLAASMPPVVHNLEPYDKTIINWTLNSLKLDDGFEDVFTYENIEDSDGIRITGISENALFDSCLYIPSEIGGRNVLEIGDNAFAASRRAEVIDFEPGIEYPAELFYEGGLNKYGITEIVVPSTIRKIGKSAFAGNYLLRSISFEDSSQLETIDFCAFQNCERLSDLYLPSNVNEICGNAFNGCDSIEVMRLPGSLTEIGEEAFTNMSELYSFEWLSGSGDNFTIFDGVLFTYDKQELVQYPIKKDSHSFTMPTETEVIRDYAVSNCEYLTSVQFYVVDGLGLGAFTGSKVLQTITISELIDGDWSAFADTKWYQDRETAQYIWLGKCLLKYNGQSTTFSVGDYPSSICRIGGGAFSGSSVKNLVIPDSIKTISENILYNSGIENVYFERMSYQMKGCLSSIDPIRFNSENSSCKIWVCNSDLSEVREYNAFRNCDRLNVRKTIVTNDETGKSKEVFYGESYDLTSIVSDPESYLRDENGVVLSLSGVWYRTEETLLLEETTGSNSWIYVGETLRSGYMICKGDTFSVSGQGMQYTLTVNNVSYNIYLPIKDYRYFSGWRIGNAVNPEVAADQATELVLDRTYVYSQGGLQLYATYKKVMYRVTCFDEHFGNAGDGVYYEKDYDLMATTYMELYEDKVNVKVFEKDQEHKYIQGICLINDPGQTLIPQSEFLSLLKSRCNIAVYELNLKYVYTDMPCLSYIDSKHSNKVLMKRYFLPGTDKQETYWLAPNDKKPAEDTYYDVYGIYDLSTVQDHDDNVYVVHAAKVYMIEYRNCNQKYVTVMKSNYTYDPDHSCSLSGSIRCKNRNLVFDGYYLDSKFKVKATVISAGSNGNKIIYLKWHIAECGATRTGEKTITDADHFDQKPFDKFSFFDMTGGIAYTDLASLGIKEIIFNVSFEMKEINNGYQYMFVLAGDTRGSECYCYKDYEFWGWQIHDTFEKQEESFTLRVDNILGDDFYVLFGANGAGADDWVTRNVRLSVRSE